MILSLTYTFLVELTCVGIEPLIKNYKRSGSKEAWHTRKGTIIREVTKESSRRRRKEEVEARDSLSLKKEKMKQEPTKNKKGKVEIWL